jgi:DNA gyrase/topoisomerase IV subunit B
VRDATALQISENAEIQNIKQILGLQHGKAYDDVKALRYGHLMIMTDQVCGCVLCVSAESGWRSPVAEC